MSNPASNAITSVNGLPGEFDPDVDHLAVTLPADGVVLVELNNPDQRNAMSMNMTAAWARLTDRLSRITMAGNEVRCVAVTGRGSAFCSGGDTRWIAGDPNAGVGYLRQRMEPFYRTWLGMSSLDIPMIVAINGPAVGAGACLALSADIRLAGRAGRFSVPFLRLGMHPGMATTFLLPEVVGPAAARDLLLTGRMIDAKEMLRLGLVSRIVDDEDCRGDLVETAALIAGQAPVATRLTRVALRDGACRSLEESIRWEALAQPTTLVGTDLVEGLNAARERRSPRFTGS